MKVKWATWGPRNEWELFCDHLLKGTCALSGMCFNMYFSVDIEKQLILLDGDFRSDKRLRGFVKYTVIIEASD